MKINDMLCWDMWRVPDHFSEHDKLLKGKEDAKRNSS